MSSRRRSQKRGEPRVVLRSPSLETLVKYLADYVRSGRPNPATLEDLLVYLRNRGLKVTYHQLRRRLEALEEKGLVRRVAATILYECRVDGGKPRYTRVRKTLWLIRAPAIQRLVG